MNEAFRGGEPTVKLVVGLGNPGAEYAGSRHNAGFMVIERLLGSFPAGRFVEMHAASSTLYSGRFRRRQLFLQQPLTFMNLSGKAVAQAARNLRLQPAEILVVSDDLDLPLGRLRLRQGGSDGGHNGLKSIIAELGSADFRRLRLGIGHPGECVVTDYVLGEFEAGEKEVFTAEIVAAEQAVKQVLSMPFQLAMNEVNRRKSEPANNACGKETKE